MSPLKSKAVDIAGFSDETVDSDIMAFHRQCVDDLEVECESNLGHTAHQRYKSVVIPAAVAEAATGLRKGDTGHKDKVYLFWKVERVVCALGLQNAKGGRGQIVKIFYGAQLKKGIAFLDPGDDDGFAGVPEPLYDRFREDFALKTHKYHDVFDAVQAF